MKESKYEIRIVPTGSIYFEIKAFSEEQAKERAILKFKNKYPLLHVHTISATEVKDV